MVRLILSCVCVVKPLDQECLKNDGFAKIVGVLLPFVVRTGSLSFSFIFKLISNFRKCNVEGEGDRRAGRFVMSTDGRPTKFSGSGA